MKRIMKWMMGALAVLGAAVLLAAGGFGSAGSRLQLGWREHASPGAWEAEYLYFSGSSQHALRGGGELLAEVASEGGALQVQILDAAGQVVFSREERGTDRFTVSLPGGGTIRLTGEGHQGGFSFRWAEGDGEA